MSPSPKKRDNAGPTDGRRPPSHASDPEPGGRRRSGRLTIRPDATPLVGSRMTMTEDEALLRLPLVRNGSLESAGRAEATWKAWIAVSASRQG